MSKRLPDWADWDGDKRFPTHNVRLVIASGEMWIQHGDICAKCDDEIEEETP